MLPNVPAEQQFCSPAEKLSDSSALLGQLIARLIIVYQLQVSTSEYTFRLLV